METVNLLSVIAYGENTNTDISL